MLDVDGSHAQRGDSLFSEDFSSEAHTRRTADFCADAADEFQRTEETYRDSLRVLREGYLKPLLNATEAAAAASNEEDATAMPEPRSSTPSTTSLQPPTAVDYTKCPPAELHLRLSSYFGDLFNVIACHELLQQKVDEATAQLASGSRQESKTATPTTALPSDAQATGGGDHNDVPSPSSSSSSPVEDIGCKVRPNSDKRASSSYAGLTESARTSSSILGPRSGERTSSIIAGAVNFPVLLLDMSASFHAAYVPYIMNYDANIAAVNAAAEVLKSTVGGEAGYANVFGQLIQGMREQHGATLKMTDLSLSALVTTPLKRLTNYNLLTQEWIGQLSASGQPVEEEVLQGQASIRDLLTAVDRCRELLRMGELLRDLERRYNIAGLATGESELILEGQMVRATRQKAAEWKLRPCEVLVCGNRLYIAKLTAPDGNTRSIQTVELRSIESVRKVSKRTVPKLPNASGLFLQWRRRELPPQRGRSETRNSLADGDGQASYSASTSPAAADLVVVSPGPAVEMLEVYLLSEDELEVNTWVQRVSQAIDGANAALL